MDRLRLGILVMLMAGMASVPAVSFGQVFRPPAGVGAPQATVLVPEGNDFATQVLRAPWDMNSLSDVSAYLNRSGQSFDVTNVQVANGLFSATSASTDANFTLLFPGYKGTIKTGKDGSLNPIASAAYRCLYFAMNARSTGQAQVIWFGDDRLNGAGGQWAFSNGIPVLDSLWNLYKYDLTTALPAGNPQTPWTSRSTWQGLRLGPTNQANADFQVDWVRLTDCNPVRVPITWKPDLFVQAIWLLPADGSGRQIRIEKDIAGVEGAAILDAQGIQPGLYTVGLGTDVTCCTQTWVSQLQVNQAPIAQFLRPSYTSGADYATQAGNPWDFSDAADVHGIFDMATSLHDSLFDMTTQSVPLATGDAQFFLNTPQPVNGSVYRYLSYRMFTEWVHPWPNVPQGMIVRWIWGIQGADGATNSFCYLVGNDMPFDLGWRVYNVDLQDPFNGIPLQTSQVDCPAQTPTWASSPPILQLRFDPNENITQVAAPIPPGGPFHQILDWVRLTALDQVTHGTPYELQLNLNRPAGDVTNVEYFYTTDRNQPTQSPALPVSVQTASRSFHAYLPLLQVTSSATASGDTFPSVDLRYLWDTTTVQPNTYYVCTVITMAPNTATYCSDTPIQVN